MARHRLGTSERVRGMVAFAAVAALLVWFVPTFVNALTAPSSVTEYSYIPQELELYGAPTAGNGNTPVPVPSPLQGLIGSAIENLLKHFVLVDSHATIGYDLDAQQTDPTAAGLNGPELTLTLNASPLISKGMKTATFTVGYDKGGHQVIRSAGNRSFLPPFTLSHDGNGEPVWTATFDGTGKVTLKFQAQGQYGRPCYAVEQPANIHGPMRFWLFSDYFPATGWQVSASGGYYTSNAGGFTSAESMWATVTNNNRTQTATIMGGKVPGVGTC